jgi:undecaprenyl-diphosphatase
MFLAFLMGEVLIKNLIQRPRPIDESIRTLLFHLPVTYSFPSGHAASSFAASGVLAKHFPQHGKMLYALAAMIAFSRVYLTLHYPSDLLAGLLLGLACSFLVVKTYKRKKRLN